MNTVDNSTLQEGTKLNTCTGCGTEYVVIEEMAASSHYCSATCKEKHSIFDLKTLREMEVN